MAEITYTTDTSGVNWEALKAILVEDDFDNGRTPEQYRISFENSYLCVLAYDEEGRCIGNVRVLSDGVCNAYIVDVWTYSPYRKQGIASQMMKLAMSKLEGQHIYLFTDDAMDFYATLGFEHPPTGMGR
ncbi:MAG: GNAT family N-acetyltransferase, partial [Anaerolineae bacterium]|nr:GNAT family N-acetyltransferase [Anaerolineae bacterium]